MAKSPRVAPAPGDKINVSVLDDTAIGMRIHADPQGALMDNWTLAYNASERGAPSDRHIGKFCMIRTKDGRNLSMRIFRTHGTENWTLVSIGGSVEEDVAVEWVALVRMILPR